MKESYEFSPWINEDLEKLAVLTENFQPEKYRKNESLYSVCGKSEYIYIVVSGRIRVTAYHTSGKERQLYIAERGCIVGEISALLNRIHNTTASAIVNSVVYKIPSSIFLKQLQQNHTISNVVMQMICRKHDILSNALLSSSFSQSASQIARMLLNLADQYGEETEDGLRIGIRFTHQDIANITGISRVTVSNCFNLFAEKGICGRINGSFMITDLDSLTEYSLIDE